MLLYKIEALLRNDKFMKSLASTKGGDLALKLSNTKRGLLRILLPPFGFIFGNGR